MINLFENNATLYDYFEYYEVQGDYMLYLDCCIKNKPILELGCGTGRVGLEIAKAGYAIDELDFSNKMLEVFEKKLIQQPQEIQNRVTLIHGDMRDFNLNKKYGLIFVPFNTITYLNDTEFKSTLDCVRLHLVDDGCLIVYVDKQEWRSNFPIHLEKTYSEIPYGDMKIHYVHWIDSTNEDERSIIYSLRHDFYRDGVCIRSTEPDTLKIWYRTYEEYCTLFSENGFRITNVWSSFDKDDVDDTTERYIFRAVLND